VQHRRPAARGQPPRPARAARATLACGGGVAASTVLDVSAGQPPPATTEPTAGWGVIGMLAAAQFVMVLDTTVMNVSITQVVEDLDTTVVGLQSAITAYTLVMAAFMLVGGKIGDRWGAKRAFWVGMIVYGTGSMVTALSPNLTVLLLGWSLVEGLGAVLVIPAIAALTAATYQGRQRALCYGILGGVAGASMAAGPLVGGWVTANFTWRLVFAGETVVVLVIMAFLRLIPATAARRGPLDTAGAALSAAGLGAVVLGVLRSSQWGWLIATPAAPFPLLGLSPTFWLLVAGGLLLGVFARHEGRVASRGGDPLVDLALLGLPRMRAGLVVQACQAFIIQASFFVLPLYLQTVLGFDALETGATILPLSIALFGFALGGAAVAGRWAPKRIVEAGLASLLVGEVVILAFIAPDLRTVGFGTGMALLGAGLGLMASQVGNVIMSSVEPRRGGEAGGLQGTSLNLGASLGVALVGSIVIGLLASGFTSRVVDSAALPPDVTAQVVASAENSANFVPADQVEAAAVAAGLPSDQVRELVRVYSDAQLQALRAGFAFLGLFALLALAWVRRLPAAAGGDGAEDGAEASGTEPVTRSS
jgi:MFS family permease